MNNPVFRVHLATAWFSLTQAHLADSITLLNAALGEPQVAQQALMRTLILVSKKPQLQPHYLQIACGMAFMYTLHKQLQHLSALADRGESGRAQLEQTQRQFLQRLGQWNVIAKHVPPGVLTVPLMPKASPNVVAAALAKAPQNESTQALKGLIRLADSAASSIGNLFINTTELTAAHLGYSFESRPSQARAHSAPTLEEFPKVAASNSNIELRSRSTQDTSSQVTLGWLKNGRPVALRRVWSGTDRNSNAVWAQGSQALASAQQAQLDSWSGVGPRFHGLRPSYNPQTGQLECYYEVTDIVPSDFLGTADPKPTAAAQQDLMQSSAGSVAPSSSSTPLVANTSAPLSESSVGYSTSLRLSQKDPQQALSMLYQDFPRVQVTQAPATLGREIPNGWLAWMNGRPVALQRIQSRDASDLDNRGWAPGGLSLQAARSADLVSRLGVGAPLHGLYTSFNASTNRQEHYLVTDVVLGDALNTADPQKITAQTFRDLENILWRCRTVETQIGVSPELNFYLTPESRLVVKNDFSFGKFTPLTEQSIALSRDAAADRERARLIKLAPEPVGREYMAWLKEQKPGEWSRLKEQLAR
jgi:hypothetical protein